MADWPSPIWSPLVVHVGSQECLGSDGRQFGFGIDGTASAAWPVAELAIFVPFRLVQPVLVTRLFWANGATASGNCDVGIYDEAGRKLVSAGATAQVGTSTVQQVDVTDTLLGVGNFYLAMVMDGAVGTTFRIAPGSALYCPFVGLAQMATAYPLPVTATFASMAQVYIPVMGLATGAAI